MKKKAQFGNAITYIILIVVSIIWIFPIIWIVLTSFRGESGQFVSYFIPHEFTADNYKVLFTNSDYPFLRWFGNTFIVAVFSCIISTFLTTSMAYVLSRLRFRMRKPIMKIALVLNMFPAFMSMIAVYYILKAMNLTQSLAALVLVYSAGSALTFYVSKGFFDTMPKALDESAQIDGASGIQRLFRVTIPMMMPSITICMFLSITNGFKLFDQNLSLTAGEPSKMSEMMALNIFNTFYGRTGWEGVGQAKAVIFFVIVVGIGLIQLRATRSKEVQQ